MAIKNKDGSRYKLVGPNPIMKNQSHWVESVQVHNFQHQEMVTSGPQIKQGESNLKIIISEETPVVPELPTVPEPPQDPPKKEFVDLRDIQPEDLKVPVREIPVTDLPRQPKRRNIPDNVPKILAYCLPVSIVDHFDPLYGDRKRITTYGIQYSMEIIALNMDDLAFQFWTNVPTLEKGSIVFTPSDRRWWRVGEIVSQSGGLTASCYPSDLTPSFALT